MSSSTDVSYQADGREEDMGRPVQPVRPEAWQQPVRPDKPAWQPPSTPLPPWQQPGNGGGGVLPTEPPPYVDPDLPAGRRPLVTAKGTTTVLGFSPGQWAVIAALSVGVAGAGFYFGRRSKR